jgi:hypothetical protein
MFNFGMKHYNDIKLATEMAGDILNTEEELDEFGRQYETCRFETRIYQLKIHLI